MSASSDATSRPTRVACRRGTQRGDWQTIRTLLPYLWGYRGRIGAALACLVLAKVANVGVPVLMKKIVDSLDPRIAVLSVPLALLVAYGLLRLSTTVFTELREFLFAKVTQRAVRRIALTVFRHLHALSLRFHLARQTGGLTRDVERGQRGISTLIGFALFSILPTLVEISFVSAILIARYDWTFMAITAVALGALHPVHDQRHRMAHALPPADERARLEGEHAGDRQPAELRDGQVFRQRGVGGAALRREPAALGTRGGAVADVAVRRSTSGRARSSRSRSR